MKLIAARQCCQLCLTNLELLLIFSLSCRERGRSQNKINKEKEKSFIRLSYVYLCQGAQQELTYYY